MSPPTWVVWIEIAKVTVFQKLRRSPPTRVVWIEIDEPRLTFSEDKRHHPHGWCGLKFVLGIIYLPSIFSHHPHGWCGLKYKMVVQQ